MSHEPHRSPLRHLDFTSVRLLYWRRVLGTILLSAGVERATNWATWLARNVFDLSPPARQKIESNLATTYGPTLSADQRSRLARETFENVARFWIEALYVPRLLRPSSWQRFVTIADPDVWTELMQERRPILFVSGYYGNPAVGAYALAQTLGPLHVLADQLPLPVLVDWQRDLYNQPNLVPVYRNESLQKLPDIVNAGGRVLILGEQPRKHGHAVEVPFLGTTRRCYPTIGVLAARYNAPVVVYGCDRHDKAAFQFRLRCVRVIDPATMQDGDPVRTITRLYMQSLEQLAMLRPAHYLWTRAGGQ